MTDGSAAPRDDLEQSGDERVEEVEEGELRLLDVCHHVAGAEEYRLPHRRLVFGSNDEPGQKRRFEVA